MNKKIIVKELQLALVALEQSIFNDDSVDEMANYIHANSVFAELGKSLLQQDYSRNEKSQIKVEDLTIYHSKE